MTTIGTTGTDLHWDVLTIKRPGLTREFATRQGRTDVGGEFIDAYLR
jgi:hypothetical protein